MFKEKIKSLINWNVEKDPKELTEKEILIQQERKHQKMLKGLMACDCFGLHYSDHFYRTHTAEEIEERWRNDVESLKKVLEEYVGDVDG